MQLKLITHCLATALAFLPRLVRSQEEQCCYSSEDYGSVAVKSIGDPSPAEEALCSQYGEQLTPEDPIFTDCWEECCYRPNGDIHYIGKRSTYIENYCVNNLSGVWEACPDTTPLYTAPPTEAPTGAPTRAPHNDQCCYSSEQQGYIAMRTNDGDPTEAEEELCYQHGEQLTPEDPYFTSCWEECCYRPNGDIHYVGKRSNYITNYCVNNFNGEWRDCPNIDGEPLYTVDTTTEAGAGGDPHFHTWGGEWYDFHGVCDLVLLDAPDYAKGLGAKIHIRTKQMYQYSFIETAALQLGDDRIEISSWGIYSVNGVDSAKLPAVLSDGALTLTRSDALDADGTSHKRHRYTIVSTPLLDASKKETIQVNTFKNMVSIKVVNATRESFGSSRGLMGRFGDGKRLARDGESELLDADEFGQEWQVVQSREPQLFETPPAGGKCKMPTSTDVASAL